MNTDKEQIETNFRRGLDPFADTRTFPGEWDLSDMPPLPENQADGSENQDESDSLTIDHGLEPGAMDEWHLAAYFDEHIARKRRGWSAY